MILVQSHARSDMHLEEKNKNNTLQFTRDFFRFTHTTAVTSFLYTFDNSLSFINKPLNKIAMHSRKNERFSFFLRLWLAAGYRFLAIFFARLRKCFVLTIDCALRRAQLYFLRSLSLLKSL